MTARTIRTTIRTMVDRGRTDTEIRSMLVARFGEDIDYTPRGDGLVGLVWVLPVLVGGAAVAAPPMNRMVVAVLAMGGFFVALYLFSHNLGLGGPIVCGVGDCATVQSSRYATLGPVPVSAIGVLGYVVLLALSFMGLQPKHRESRMIGGLLLVGSLGGGLFSAYLTYLEAFVIQAWCQYCVASAIIIALIFVASIPEVARLRGGS